MSNKRSRSWLFEVPLFYLMLITLQRGAFPADPAFRALNPNPLWLGILLFGLRYGIGAGLVSGAISAALLALGAKQAGEGFRLEDADFYVQPGLFIIFGAALGAVAEAWWNKVDALNLQLADLKGRNRGLLYQINTQQKALRAVEQQVVSQMSSVVTLYHGSRELGTLDRAGLMTAMLEFFTRALDATKTALYLPGEDGRWKLMDSRGWDAGDSYPREISAGEGVVGRCAAEGRVTTLKDALAALEEGAKAGPGTDAIMAAPILGQDGKPAAIFAVQAMPFLRFNSAAISLAALLSEWGSESLAKCAEVEGLRSRSLLDEDLAVHSSGYLEKRLTQEFARSRRFALPLSLLLARVTPGPKVPEERRRALLSAAARVLRETTRDIDIVARSPFPEADLAVLLPTATRERAEEVLQKAREALAGLDLPAEVRFGLGAYAAAMPAPEDLIEDAQRPLR